MLHNIDGLITRNNKFRKNVLEEMANNYNALMICLTETHLNESYAEAEVHMSGYVLYRADRQEGRKKGGVAVYLREQFSVGAEQMYAASNGFVETLVLYLRTLKAIVVTMYRPPKLPILLL